MRTTEKSGRENHKAQISGHEKLPIKIPIDYSDHSMICIDMNINVSRLKKHSIITRDMRKLKSNPQFFLKELSKLDWASFVNMSDVDKMEEEWTKERNNCLNKNN